MADQLPLLPPEKPARRRRKTDATKPPQLRLIGFLRLPGPPRARSRKGVAIARHMVPLARLPGVEEELARHLEIWIAAWDRECVELEELED